MGKLPPQQEIGENNSETKPPSTPRWVKVFGIIAIVLLLLFFILKLTGLGGDHGPGRHMQNESHGDDTSRLEQEVDRQ